SCNTVASSATVPGAAFPGNSGALRPGTAPAQGRPRSPSPTFGGAMRKSLIFIVVTGLVAACGDNPKPPPPASPTIQSFGATPSGPIAVGSSASLGAVFSGGTGVVNPGGMSISSGKPIDVTPSATTIYTLVVTASGGQSARANATVTLDTVDINVGTEGGTA